MGENLSKERETKTFEIKAGDVPYQERSKKSDLVARSSLVEEKSVVKNLHIGEFWEEEKYVDSDEEKLISEKVWRRIDTFQIRKFTKKEANELLATLGKLERVQCFNLILVGQMSSGKSSFFNSCATGLLDKKSNVTLSSGLESQRESVTACLEAHTIKMSSKTIPQLRIYDCRGLHDLNGVHSEDIKSICVERTENGYTLDHKLPIRSENEIFRERPTIQGVLLCFDMVECLRKLLHVTDERSKEQLKEIRAELSADRSSFSDPADRYSLVGVKSMIKNLLFWKSTEGEDNVVSCLFQLKPIRCCALEPLLYEMAKCESNWRLQYMSSFEINISGRQRILKTTKNVYSYPPFTNSRADTKERASLYTESKSFCATNKHKQMIWVTTLPQTISLKTKEHGDERLQQLKRQNDKKLVEVKEKILRMLHYLDQEMNIRERKRMHTSI